MLGKLEGKDKKELSETTKTDESLISILVPAPPEIELRTITAFGDITEELCKEVVEELWDLCSTAKVTEPTDPDDPDSDLKEVIRPIEMLISTNGGIADDMFAIYDSMRMIREEVEIKTIGLGKVMSAGTLLLAAGTKGKRTIGKYCRVMIHSIIGGPSGPMHQLENEMKEVKAIQDTYIRAMCEETNMTQKQLRRLLKKKVNVYLTAEEAVQYGFADIVV